MSRQIQRGEEHRHRKNPLLRGGVDLVTEAGASVRDRPHAHASREGTTGAGEAAGAVGGVPCAGAKLPTTNLRG